jgi:hypothetical protein
MRSERPGRASAAVGIVDGFREKIMFVSTPETPVEAQGFRRAYLMAE